MQDLQMSRSCLERELQTLEQIEANMGTQIRFIAKRKIKGLNRLTRELETLIHTFAGLENELRKDRRWLGNSELQGLIKTIEGKKQEIFRRGKESVTQAELEREKIDRELQRARKFKIVHRQYANIRFAMSKPSFDHKG